MKSILIHPQSREQVHLFEQLAKVLNIPFEKKEEKSPYDPKFVAQIKKAEKDIKAGRVTKIDPSDIWNLT